MRDRLNNDFHHIGFELGICPSVFVSCIQFQVDMAQENFEKISRIIRKEFEAFDIKKCQDFKQTILQYLEQMLK